ncbi:hypothetical protein [Nocardioides ganghwensis]|jgi:hypothetical protein|uniref:Uncharacterized protein n=1 Tax=Nocardioides ganghwensis TaxID=252230 RepID=A0A4Q2SDX8_9ACTN|nr:hypothetical protein [Nocardioides ganghwensis]MBD3945735.1 hypothetical protein [Nocardioides ganghwensis]RYC01138.1 hypothetical protein EUA07_12175 [Nocardioides ganghwensis]
MRTHESLLLKPAQGWVVACVMTALFVLMGASGDDVFARHVGMSASVAGISGTSADLDRTTASSDAPRAAGDVPPARSGHGTGDGADAAHVLHLLGACLAILIAGALLLHRRGWWPWSARATAALSPRLVFPASWLACVRRGPPRLTPPRFSPVIRT